jgi:ribosomal protein S8
MVCSLKEAESKDQSKRRTSTMKMRITVTIENEDESVFTEPTTTEVSIPGVEAFTGPQVFDQIFNQYERGVLEARNGVIEEATEKYLSEVAKKSPSGVGRARREPQGKTKRLSH